MTHSEKLNELAAALSAFQAAMKPVPKTKTVPARSYSFQYAPLDEIIQQAAPLLAAHGLSVAQIPDADGLTTILMHTSGQYVAGTMPLPGKPGTAQEEGGRITYARRYAYSAILGLATEEDTDGPPEAAQVPRRNGKRLQQKQGPTTVQLQEAKRLSEQLPEKQRVAAYEWIGESRNPEEAAARLEKLAGRVAEFAPETA